MADDIRWVLFDADGVLQRMPADWQQRIEPLLGDAPDESMLAIVTAEAEALTGADFRALLAEVLHQRGLACDPEDLLAFWRMIEVDQPMMARVADLRAAGIGCALATNQQHIRVDYMRGLRDYQGVFDAQFYSAELGVAKPDPAYFTAILERLQLPADQVLFLDDRADNVAGAQAAGLQATEFAQHQSVAELDRILADYGIVQRASVPSGPDG